MEKIGMICHRIQEKKKSMDRRIIIDVSLDVVSYVISNYGTSVRNVILIRS